MEPIRQFILQLPTFLPTIHATDDFATVLAHLIERWDWAIAAYRSYLSLPGDNRYIIISTLVFLAIAQGMRLIYSRMTAEQLRTLVDTVGPRVFTVVTAIPSFGVIIIPLMQILYISGSPFTAVGLVLAITVPVVILPLAVLCFQIVRMQGLNDAQA
ncbi:hypothetical protein F5J12DRAFT_845711 [Pisolithus orientalis]|uniref:uncharacterized protein n=1 Tax=Pisolithus orientalis TaxID=936130 RepID=UPI0022245E34|nr:uncharacterized protein F5J12DRAFT_845711 [Pisolithus orientalis]KAI6000380.1 hypothetical protein F5J12DRAFT_845711 [Pisolithus orientalis]